MVNKKLIEVALPLEAINAASSREKSIRHGHPSTLHLWWARRPLAAAKAVIWSSLVDDPSSHPDEFPTEEAQNAERQRLFGILEQLVVWENSNNQEVLDAAKAEIMKSANGNPPELLDPFAGGGAIPLEAQRLGLKAHAHDLNPVAVMINKAMIEIPPKFADMPAVNPVSRISHKDYGWHGAEGLAEDVRYYGDYVKRMAFERVGNLYPKVTLPKDQGGKEVQVISWLWTRTVKCPNPACGCRMPLASSFVLSSKKGKEACVIPEFDYESKKIHYRVFNGKCTPPKSGKTSRGAKFKCIMCGESTTPEYIKTESINGQMGLDLMAIVAEGNNGRTYLEGTEEQLQASRVEFPENSPRGEIGGDRRALWTPLYGLCNYEELFTKRQLTTLVTFCEVIDNAVQTAYRDALRGGMNDDNTSLEEGGCGAYAYSQAVGVYLSFALCRMTNIFNSLCRWESSRQQALTLFARQGIPMVWDFAENNAFSGAAGDFSVSLKSILKVLHNFKQTTPGIAEQFDAQSDCGLRNVMVSTDPPYYDNIGYADLSDFFYIWMRKTLKGTYPHLFKTMLVPKKEELVATPYRFDDNMERARAFFEEGMLQTCKQIYTYTNENYPVTIYYAYKQNETDEGDRSASSGWETMLSAIIQSGFSITGTWPMRTEMANRSVASGTNALASSIVLVCRRRPESAPQTTRRNFINELRRELKPALQKLQQSNIAPVDLAQSAIGPGMAVFSKYKKVLEADGSPMSVRSALQIINQELDIYFNEQDGELDRDSRFCVELYAQNAFNDIKFGDADTLARAKNTSVAGMVSKGVLYAQKGVVHLLSRDEISNKVQTTESMIWLLTQQLTYAMEKGGIEACAKIVAPMFGSNAEYAKSLAYRLYTIAERKGWAQEAYAYNSLVVAWPDIQSRAAELQEEKPKQMSIFDLMNDTGNA